MFKIIINIIIVFLITNGGIFFIELLIKLLEQDKYLIE